MEIDELKQSTITYNGKNVGTLNILRKSKTRFAWDIVNLHLEVVGGGITPSETAARKEAKHQSDMVGLGRDNELRPTA